MQNKILYVQYTNPACYTYLEHGSKMLASRGWEVLFLGIGAYGAADKLRFRAYGNIRVKNLSYCTAAWLRPAHYLYYCLWAIGWAIIWRPTHIYASEPPICPMVLLLNRFWGAKIIYHEHDSPGLDEKPRSILRKIVLWSRRKLGIFAALCILPNQERAESFAEGVGSKENVFTVWNCPSKEEVPSAHLSRKDGIFWILYQGSVVPDRLPETVIKALGLLPSHVKLRIIGYETLGHIGYIRQLEKLAQSLGIFGRIEYAGSMGRDQLMKQSALCDAGIALMPMNTNDINMRCMVGASGKAFDYLACGLPVLVSDFSDWKRMYVEPGYGLACCPDNPESIASAIEWLISHPDEMRKMREAGRQRILGEWNYENQFAPILARLESGMLPKERCPGH